MRSIFKNARGIRAGWRLLIYAALVFAFGYAATRLSDALSHGRQWDYASPVVQIVAMAVLLAVLLSAAATMAKIEGRSIAEYGLPWWRAFCVKFWQASAIGFISLAVLLAVLRAANAYSVGSLQIHGIEILKNAILWAVAVILAAMVEEFFYRGYIQFTLSDGIGFWPAAVVASAIMGGMHALNPGWTALGLATVFGFGLIACFLLRRTGDLWMPIGLHAAWNWGEIYFFGVPCSGLMGNGHLLQGSFHGPDWLTGMPFGVEAGWPNVALFLIWWAIFAKWLRNVKYPRTGL
jgi:hypothetical protein